MIDHEDAIFDEVATLLRANFEGIHIIGREITDTPPSFPAVSIIQSDNTINGKYSTFESKENVAIESYKFEIVSNLEKGEKEAQCKAIAGMINSIMVDTHAYTRTFNQPVPSADTSLARRVLRYTQNISI